MSEADTKNKIYNFHSPLQYLIVLGGTVFHTTLICWLVWIAVTRADAPTIILTSLFACLLFSIAIVTLRAFWAIIVDGEETQLARNAEVKPDCDD